MVSSENKQWLQDKISEFKDEAAKTVKNLGIWKNMSQAKQEIVSRVELLSRRARTIEPYARTGFQTPTKLLVYTDVLASICII